MGQQGPVDRLTVARSVRMRLITVPGRLVNLVGTLTLREPHDWHVGAVVPASPGPATHPAALHRLRNSPRRPHRWAWSGASGVRPQDQGDPLNPLQPDFNPRPASSRRQLRR